MDAITARFLVFDWLKLDLSQHHLSHMTRSLLEQLLSLSQQLGQAALAPIDMQLNREPPQRGDGLVQTPVALKDALQALAQAGIFGTDAALAEGGTALPCVVRTAVASILSRFSPAVFDYVRQTQVAAALIRRFGSESQKQRYLPLLASGNCFGTLCLSEAQAGSSLGDVLTMARPNGAGGFEIGGEKKWVSGAEHGLCGNIIHLVLARVEGAQPGLRGLSLFIVPRLIGTNANGVRLIGLNALCGLRAVVNGDLSFGAATTCVGEMLGNTDPLGGLAITQLNACLSERCIAAGTAAAANAARGFDIALKYAQNRAQSRALGNTDAQTPQVFIATHPGVRMQLLRARALSDGACLLLLYVSKQADLAEAGDAAAKAQRAVLTPIAKCWPGRVAWEVADLAAQVTGAAGCSEALGVDQLVRDAQTMRWLEGGEGTHSLELLARQVIADNGAALVQLLQAIAQTAQRAVRSPKHQAMAASALELGAELAKIALGLGEQLKSGAPDLALCQSTTFLQALGTIVVCWLSLDVALSANGHDFEPRYVENCRYLHEIELESVRAQLATLRQFAAAQWVCGVNL